MSGARFARRHFLLLAVATILLGLVVHRLELGLPAAGRDILGDALWAMMIAWFVGFAVPTMASSVRAGVALALCWLVEFGQMYHSPAVDGWRDTTVGHLILGSSFDPRDLLAYTLGVVAALLIEILVGRPGDPSLIHSNPHDDA